VSLRQASELRHAVGNASTGTVAVVSAVAGQRVFVYRAIVTIASPAVTLVFQDTAATALSQVFQLGANPAIVLDVADNMDPWFITGLGNGLQLVQSGTSNVGFDIYYLQRSAGGISS
jgi:hypothetical protein